MRHRQGGFSLLEVLVAFSVMALALGALYHAVGGSVRATGIAEQRVRAAIVAESVLALYPVVSPGGVRHAGSSPDGFRWEFEARQFAVDAALGQAPASVLSHPMYRTEVRVWIPESGQEAVFSLVTLLPEGRQ